MRCVTRKIYVPQFREDVLKHLVQPDFDFVCLFGHLKKIWTACFVFLFIYAFSFCFEAEISDIQARNNKKMSHKSKCQADLKIQNGCQKNWW